MPNFNKVILAGNLTRDPELRFSAKGTAVCNLSIAINESWKDQDGQKRESVTFVDATAFGKTGEIIAQFLRKGRPILIEGMLQTSSWDDKTTGKKKSRLGVVLESFQFLDSNGQRESQPANTSNPGTVTRPATSDIPLTGSEPVGADALTPDDGDPLPF